MVKLRMPKLVRHMDCYLGTHSRYEAGLLLNGIWQAQDWMDLCGRAEMPLWQARCEKYIVANADQEDLAEMAYKKPLYAMRVLDRLVKKAGSTDKGRNATAITAAKILCAALAQCNAEDDTL